MGDVIGDINSRRGQYRRYGSKKQRTGNSLASFLWLKCSVIPQTCVPEHRAVVTM